MTDKTIRLNIDASAAIEAMHNVKTALAYLEAAIAKITVTPGRIEDAPAPEGYTKQPNRETAGDKAQAAYEELCREKAEREYAASGRGR